MEAIVKFNDEAGTQAVLPGFFSWDFRRLDNGEMLIQFFDEDGKCLSLFPMRGVLGVDFNYDE